MADFDHNQQDDESGTGSSSGDQTGKVKFRNFIGTGGENRDDLLSADEKRHLLMLHQDLSEAKIKQQKEKRQQYQDLKNGKTTLRHFRDGLVNAGKQAFYRVFPALANKAQFSGSTDSKVTPNPDQFIAETNQDKRNELKYQPQLTPQNQLRPNYMPKFDPRPRGPGG